jgi:hypothetical protein
LTKPCEDAIPWLQAGLLAFKHAVLCKRLVCRDPQVRVLEAEEKSLPPALKPPKKAWFFTGDETTLHIFETIETHIEWWCN